MAVNWKNEPAFQVSDAASARASAAELKSQLAAIVGDAAVSADETRRALHSQDIWSLSDNTVALVVSPATVEQISRVVAAVHAAGYAVVPRGAGMSYTGAYHPESPHSVSLDMSRMDAVESVNADDMTVTVQPGCTWSKLYSTLKPLGLRTPFWGPMSGLTSTVGGGLSQLNAMLGAGHHGTSSESVVALTVVLANGGIVQAPVRAAVDGDTPFYRHYGPDLAGAGSGGDCGASSVSRPTHHVAPHSQARCTKAIASFSFPSGRGPASRP